MKAISLWQPWATLVALGAKRFETRSWSTNYRGTLAIHAAKRPINKSECNEAIIDTLLLAGYSLSDLPFGCVVCTVQLLRCERTVDAVAWRMICDTEMMFGDYSPGRYAWKLYNPQPVPNIPFRGRQGFWEIPDEILRS